MLTYIAWLLKGGDSVFQPIGTRQGQNAWHTVLALIEAGTVDAGDRVFLIGQMSAAEPFGGALYDIVPTSITPRAVA